MNRNAKGRRCQGGFTLTETLVAMLLMSFVGLIVTGGISMGARVYGEITERSNAELLLSTTLMRMRDELDRVEETWESGGNTFYRTSFSNWRTLETSGVENKPGVFIQEYKGYNITKAPKDEDKLEKPWPLVTEAMGGNGKNSGKGALYATFDSLTYESGCFKVGNLRVCKQLDDTPVPGSDKVVASITDQEEYKIRCLQKVTPH